MDFRGNYGNRINRLRNHLNMTQHEFGEKIGVTQQYVGNMEAGKRKPGPALVFVIATTFKRIGVTEGWIRTGEGGCPFS